ncbi:hypothetical protein O181_015419 [Austropuccinia psidii MF-1]|uniref:Uncharacterized protein n=1 Tax=Austropuccinia psidii MF-1 TaxID=1389203 RepID=A0A9Q3GQU1_9BASI|nr:hypothetical protein [Austropuccinia psidii MF-1]
MSPVCLRNPGIPRNQPEDRQGLFRTRRPGTGYLGQSGCWQDTDGNHTHSAIKLPIQQKTQTRGLEGYRSSSSAPQTPQRSIPMEHGQQEVQPSITRGRTWSKLTEDMSQRNNLQRPYGNHNRQLKILEESKTGIRESQATIQGIEEQLNQTEPTLIPSGSQGVDQPSSPVDSYHSGTGR